MSDKGISSTDFNFPGQTNVYHGKVRDVYTIDDKYIVAVATDRISAFDVILPRPIPHKGQVLNQIADYFLQKTADIAPNWVKNVPDPNVTIGIKCEPFKIEMIIRGCLVGSSWRAYQSGKREICGIPIPGGMKEYDPFPEPIITPTTKAEAGHDEDISADQIVAQGLATKEEFEQLSDYARKLFASGQAMAKEQGLFLADTKYEFGKLDGKIYVIDEIHTPDSSRYFYSDSYEAFVSGKSQELPRHLSKEFVREWLMERSFSGQKGEQLPEMDDEFVEAVSKRYIELFEEVTGQDFKPASYEGITERIQTNVNKALKEIL